MCVYILTNTSVSSFHSAWTVRLYKIFFSFVSSLKDAILCTTFTLARYLHLSLWLTNIQASGIDCLFVQKCNEKKADACDSQDFLVKSKTDYTILLCWYFFFLIYTSAGIVYFMKLFFFLQYGQRVLNWSSLFECYYPADLLYSDFLRVV